jgi:hypothetical protein
MNLSATARLECVNKKAMEQSLKGVKQILKLENHDRKKLKCIKRELKFIIKTIKQL